MNSTELNKSIKNIEATYHSLVRAKERLGLKADAAEREIRKAFMQDLDVSEFTAREKEYLNSKEIYGAAVKVYKNICYIFSEEGVCITVYKVPGWFGRRQFFDGKKKIRNPKDYYRHYGVIA